MITITERIKDILNNSKKYDIERKVFSYSIILFLLITGIQAIAYFIFLKNIPNFISIYGWWLFYLNISIATGATAIWNIFAYKAKISCMVGMMIAMTIGMQTGMMIGAVIGATNGYFTGALSGMLIGTIAGIIGGRLSTTMGLMHGMMAGVMGGTMGPMITVMMFTNNVLFFMPFYIIINVAILFSMTIMLYEEFVENQHDVIKKPTDFTTLASLTIVATMIIMAIIIYTPKSVFIGG
ncbi:MAG: hypothetical protein ACMXYG_06220 [Candidatus Woesearchaeota archaeon]